MPEDPVQEFYQHSYSQQKTYRSRWHLLNRWLPSASRVDVAISLLPGGKRLLDVGCGNGELLLKASPSYSEVYGFDVATVNIERAQQTLAALRNCEVKLIAGNIDVDGLPFEDSFFDSTTCIAVLQHVFDVYGAFKEIRRVLKPGGTLVLETNNLAYFGHRLALLLGKQPRTSYFDGWDGNTLHYFVPSSLRELIEVEGFQVQHVCSAGRLSRMRTWWPSMLAQNVLIVALKK
jgi:ubiquinone/menaquinone biosynthesis C-methylase UbiE